MISSRSCIAAVCLPGYCPIFSTTKTSGGSLLKLFWNDSILAVRFLEKPQNLPEQIIQLVINFIGLDKFLYNIISDKL